MKTQFGFQCSCVVSPVSASLPKACAQSRKRNIAMVSERQIVQYKDSMKSFENPLGNVLNSQSSHIRNEARYPFKSRVTCPTTGPYDQSYELIHETLMPVFTDQECQLVVDEAEEYGRQNSWATKRHGSYPTTDIPLTKLPRTLKLFNEKLYKDIYPLLGEQFRNALPDVTKLRVVDAFVVKYSEQGQRSLEPHRDGSVVSLNIALNPMSEFEGGGTWFAGIDQSLRVDQGHMMSHASGMLHAGHPITTGKRYILVAFLIVEDFQNFATRFLQDVRNC